MTARHHTVVATLLVLLGLYFMRLTAVEIQPAPEGLIAERGESIAIFGEWADQSAKAPGGLTTASKPPLTSWLVAMGMAVVGKTPLAARWFTILAAVGACFLTYRVGQRILSFQHSVLAMVAVGISVPFVLYARQANDAIPFVAFALMALDAVLVCTEGAGGVRRILAVVALAAGVAGCLLTMPVSAIVVIALGVAALGAHPGRMPIVGGLILGLVIGLPWYIGMWSTYGEQFLLAFGIPQGGGYGAAMGPLGLVGQVLAAAPVIGAALVWCIVGVFRRTVLPDRTELATLLVMVWFVAGLPLAALFSDRSFLSVAVLVPPAAIMALRAVEVFQRPGNAALLVLLYGAMIGSSVIAVLINVLHLGMQGAGIVVYLSVVLATACATFIAMRSGRLGTRIAVAWYRPVIYGVVALSAVVALFIVLRGFPSQVVGGRDVAAALHEDTLAVRSFAYLYHSEKGTDAINAQLGWYTNGWMNGWRPRYRHAAAAMPPSSVDVGVAESLRGLSWVVYYHPGIGIAEQRVVRDALGSAYDVHTATPDYTVYRNR